MEQQDPPIEEPRDKVSRNNFITKEIKQPLHHGDIRLCMWQTFRSKFSMANVYGQEPITLPWIKSL